jgi:hypothetical protein
MTCCGHAHGPWCHGHGYVYGRGYWPEWEPQEPSRRRRRAGRDERLQDLEDQQAALQQELAEISESLRRIKQGK